MVPHCPEPLTPPLISLSRAMYEFFRTTKKAESGRVYEYEERKAVRLQFCQTFRVGQIRGELLREALGLPEDNSDEEEYPWYWSMMEWGYPPGWYSAENPIFKVLSHIEGGLFGPSTPAIIYGEDDISTDIAGKSDSLSESDEVKDSLCTKTIPPKRWAEYPTTLFSSELLPIYSGKRLPPVDVVETQREKFDWQREVSLPPWRRPGAFDAFGPTGWQQFVKQFQEPNADFSSCNILKDESDMDMSD